MRCLCYTARKQYFALSVYETPSWASQKMKKIKKSTSNFLFTDIIAKMENKNLFINEIISQIWKSHSPNRRLINKLYLPDTLNTRIGVQASANYKKNLCLQLFGSCLWDLLLRTKQKIRKYIHVVTFFQATVTCLRLHLVSTVAFTKTVIFLITSV